MKQIKVEINGKEYSIRDLTIADYYDLKHKALMQDMESAFEVVSRLTDIPRKELQKLKYEHWLELFIAVQGKINETFKKSDIPAETRLTLGDIEYGLIDLQNASIGEFMDLDILVSSPDLETQIHKILAILYRPFVETEDDIVFEEYDSNRCANRSEIFLELPLSIAHQALTFFLNFAKASLRHMLEYSIQEMMKTKEITRDQASRLKKLIFELLEDGSTPLQFSQTITSLNSTGQANSTTNSPLTISLGELTDKKKRRESIMNLFKNIGLN